MAKTVALLNKILVNIVNPAILLMLVLAVLFFIFGVVEFIRGADNPEGRKKGGLHILFGLIGIFIMVTAYGILNLIKSTIGV